MLVMLMLLSCVSKGTFELVEIQLDATRTALSAKNAACYEDVQDHEERIHALHLELERLKIQHASLTDRHLQLSEEVEITRQRLGELATFTPEPVVEGEETIELPPLVEATQADLVDAIALRSRSRHEADQRRKAHDHILQSFQALQDEGRLEVLLLNGHTVVRIPTVQIFNEGRVSVSPRGEVLLVQLAKVLEHAHDDVIQVAAHTDDRPYHTAEHDSSWEMGFDQAMTVLRSLEQADIPPSLNAASFAASRPIASNETAEGRKKNQRIELVFRQDLAALPGMTVLESKDGTPPEPLP